MRLRLACTLGSARTRGEAVAGRRSRRAWASGLLACALALSGATTGADEPDPASQPLTALSAGELGRSSHVVLGTLVELREVRGMALAKVHVDRWLKGAGSGDLITVLVAGPGPTADPKRPSAAYLDRRPGATYLLFLAQGASGVAFHLANRIEVRGLEGQEKVRALETQIVLEAVSDPAERARRTLAHFLAAVEAPGPWTRANAARELAYLANVRPRLFTPKVRAQISALIEGAPAPAVRTWLETLMRRLPPPSVGEEPAQVPAEPEAPPAPPPPADGGPEARRQALDAHLRRAGDQAPPRALHLLRQEQDPDLAAWLVDWLAESGHRTALPGLMTAYGRTEERSVREAIVRAVGLLGGDPEVPWLVERLVSPWLREAALLALARIRSAAAVAALEAARTRMERGTDEERDLALRIEHLLSPAFEASERAAGHPLGSGPPGGAAPGSGAGAR